MMGFLKLFTYLSAGEIIVRLTGFPIPGPILGLVLMLVDFWVNRDVDRHVAQIFDRVSSHLAVLFVPAGAGVIAYGAMVSTGLLVILIAVLVGTITTMLVTAFCFDLFLGGRQFGNHACKERTAESSEGEP